MFDLRIGIGQNPKTVLLTLLTNHWGITDGTKFEDYCYDHSVKTSLVNAKQCTFYDPCPCTHDVTSSSCS